MNKYGLKCDMQWNTQFQHQASPSKAGSFLQSLSLLGIFRSALQKAQPFIAPLRWSLLPSLNFTAFREKQDKMQIPSFCQKLLKN